MPKVMNPRRPAVRRMNLGRAEQQPEALGKSGARVGPPSRGGVPHERQVGADAEMASPARPQIGLDGAYAVG
jgi:hypothetical protein